MTRIQLLSTLFSPLVARTEASLRFLNNAWTILIPHPGWPEGKPGPDHLGRGSAGMPEPVVWFAVVTGRSRRSGAGDRN
jgi:hypothetical protein